MFACNRPHRPHHRPHPLAHLLAPPLAHPLAQPVAPHPGAPGTARRRLLLAAAGACALPAGLRAAGAGAPLLVGAAASLKEAMQEIAPLFEAAQAAPAGLAARAAIGLGARLQFTFVASGALLQQAARGAPLDVLASADLQTMAQARERGLLVAGSERVFATNRLVLVVPAGAGGGAQAAPGAGTSSGAGAGARALADLAAPRVQRIALGMPASVPAGRHAQEALEAAGLWAAVQARVVRTASVRQALDYVARGEVDAGFVYATDAALLPGRVRVVATVPTVTPIACPAAVLGASAQQAQARAFVDFLLGAAAQGVLAARGFGRP